MNSGNLVKLLSIMISLGAANAWSDVTRAKAAELSVHKAERLVALNKIEDTFLSNLTEVEVVDVVGAADGSTLKTLLKQFPAADNTQKILEVSMDKDGRVTTYDVIEGGESANPLQWPIADSASLFEYGLHYLLENGPVNADVKPFDSDFTKMVISQEPVNGTVRAHFFSYSSTNVTQKENVYINADSSFDHAEITDL